MVFTASLGHSVHQTDVHLDGNRWIDNHPLVNTRRTRLSLVILLMKTVARRRYTKTALTGQSSRFMSRGPKTPGECTSWSAMSMDRLLILGYD